MKDGVKDKPYFHEHVRSNGVYFFKKISQFFATDCFARVFKYLVMNLNWLSSKDLVNRRVLCLAVLK